MGSRTTPLVSAVSVIAFMVWLSVSTRTGQGGESPSGPGARQDAEAPTLPAACSHPVGWRIADIDPRFGLDPSAVERAIRSAADAWGFREDGRPRFEHDPNGGIPIRLVYDARQARTEERLDLEAAVRRTDRALDVEAADLSQAWERHHDQRASLIARRARLESDLARHNAAVRAWNGGRGATGADGRLHEEEGRLRELDAELRLDVERLDFEAAELSARERALADRIAERNRETELLEERFAPRAVESGAYLDRAGVDELGGAWSYREIRVFRFEDHGNLVRVMAHEFGHALGLGHVDATGAIMAGEQRHDVEGGRIEAPTAADLNALEVLCGGTGEAGGRPPGDGSR